MRYIMQHISKLPHYYSVVPKEIINFAFWKGDCIINIIPYGRLVTLDKMQRPTCVCHRLIPVLIFREEEQKDKREKIRSFVLE